MRTTTKAFWISGLLGAVLILSTSFCTRLPKNLVYRVALRYIPTSLNPYSTQVNTDNFIALQLYYPLFHHTTDGRLVSEFLDLTTTKSKDSTFRNFILCLQNQVRFSDGSAILPKDLENSLKEAHRRQEMLPALESIQQQAGCVDVTLKKPDPRYFEKLTGVASTIISTNQSSGGFPIGLGPYRIESLGSNRILLRANPGRVKGSFEKIEFRKYRDVATDYAEGIFDFNHTGQVSIPESIEKHFKRVSRPFFKSYALVVNYPDAAIRKRFFRCFPIERLRSLLAMPLKPTPGFLPNGIQGSDAVHVPSRIMSSDFCKPVSGQEMVFFNFRPEIGVDLQRLFTESRSTLPIAIHYEQGPIDELARRIFIDDKIAAVIGFDSSTSNSSAYSEAATFFESFIRESRAERLITTVIPGLSELVKTAAKSSAPDVKTEFYRKAHQMLLDSAYVIPLGQLDMDQFYPNTIRHIAWSDQISGFPDVSLMEASQ